MQGTAAIEYSWLPRDATPHNWTTEVISDLSLPITFVGLCTIDRRNIYPPKEVLTSLLRLQIVSPSSIRIHYLIWELGHAQCRMCQVLQTITLSCIANTNLCADVFASSDKIGAKFALLDAAACKCAYV